MKDLLDKFENKTPEIVFEWNDAETEAIGWVVINSLRGGAAGGGTRMRVGLDKHEVTSLFLFWGEANLPCACPRAKRLLSLVL